MGDDRVSLTRVLFAAVLAVIASTILWQSWMGFHASDDIYYYEGGKAWLTKAWHVPRGFGEVRTTVTLPISVSLAVLGDSERAAILPTCLYMLGTVLLTYWRLSRLVPSAHAVVAGILLATMPVLVLESTTSSADLAELFWTSIAFWTFVSATAVGRGEAGRLIAVGVAVALAFTAHETVLAFLLFLGVLYLVGYRIPRWRYWLMAIGFLSVIGLEAAYYAVAAGNPFYRFELLLGGFAASDDRMVVPPFSFDNAGTFRVWGPIDPLVMVLTRHNFGLVYYAILPAAVALLVLGLRRRREGRPIEPWLEQALLAAGLGAIWFVFTAIVLIRIALLPRYYLVPTYFFFVAATIFYSHRIAGRRPLLVRLAAIAIVGVNLAAISVANKNPRPGERAVAEYLTVNPGPLRTDPYTAFRSKWFVEWAHQDFSRVLPGPPKPGDRFLYNPGNAARPNRLLPSAEVPLYAPDRAWPIVWKSQDDAPLLGRLLTSLGLATYVPAAIREKLVDSKPPILVYEVTAPR